MLDKSKQDLLKDFIESGELKKLEEYILDNPDGICDDCKFSIITSDDIPPNM